MHNHRVQVYDSSLTYVDTLGVTGECAPDDDHLCTPIGVAVDDDRNVYVADGGNNRVQKFNAQGEYLMTIGEGWGDGFGQFAWAEDVEVDPDGLVYVADWSNNRVQVFSPEGAFLTSIGGASGTNSSQFQGVASVAVDSQGNLFVGDWENLRFQVFAPGVPGWQQVNINGFGDPVNIAVFAMEIFEDQLYTSSGSWVIGAQVWRMEGDGSWAAVSEPGFGEAYTRTNPAVVEMAVFEGQLYAGTGWWTGAAGQLWRSPDGETWEQIGEPGFGDIDNISLAPLGVFDGMLYVGAQNDVDGMEIWGSASGDKGDWTAGRVGG